MAHPLRTMSEVRLFRGLPPLTGLVMFEQSESVGGRAHESGCIHFVWSGGGAAYRNGGADAFSRRAFAQRHRHLKVL